MPSLSISQTHSKDEQEKLLKEKPWRGILFPTLPQCVFHTAWVAWGLPSVVLVSLHLHFCPLTLQLDLLQHLCSHPFPPSGALGTFFTDILL